MPLGRKTPTDHKADRITVIGFEADVRYVEMLFFSLRLQMLSMLEPQVNPAASYDDNVLSLHDAGIKWREIARLLNKHVKMVFREDTYVPSWVRADTTMQLDKDDLDRYVAEQSGPWGYTPWPDGGRLIRAYKRACAAKGLEPVAVPNAATYQDSWMDGFRSELRRRLTKVRNEEGAGLVLASAMKLVQESYDDLWDELFPPAPPAPVQETQAVTKSRRARKVKYQPVRYDENGAAAGRRAAQLASLARPGTNVSSNNAGELA